MSTRDMLGELDLLALDMADAERQAVDSDEGRAPGPEYALEMLMYSLGVTARSLALAYNRTDYWLKGALYIQTLDKAADLVALALLLVYRVGERVEYPVCIRDLVAKAIQRRIDGVKGKDNVALGGGQERCD